VQIHLVHKFLPRVHSSCVDGVAAVIKRARINLDDGKVLSVLSGFGGGEDGRRPNELPEDTFLLHIPVSGSLLEQGPECLQCFSHLLQSLPCLLAFPVRPGVVLVLNQVDPLHQ